MTFLSLAMAGKLGALVTLAIGRNAVRQLPGDLLSLPSLGVLLAGDNHIEAVPRQILQVRAQIWRHSTTSP